MDASASKSDRYHAARQAAEFLGISVSDALALRDQYRLLRILDRADEPEATPRVTRRQRVLEGLRRVFGRGPTPAE